VCLLCIFLTKVLFSGAIQFDGKGRRAKRNTHPDAEIMFISYIVLLQLSMRAKWKQNGN
jgi:hypothetical protein